MREISCAGSCIFQYLVPKYLKEGRRRYLSQQAGSY